MSGPGDVDPQVSGEEAAWRDLVARFAKPADPGLEQAPWPASEDLTQPQPAVGADGEAAAGEAGAPAGARAADKPPARPAGVPPPPPPQPARVVRPAAGPEPDAEDETYRPEPMPPPARLDSISKAAVAGVVGGPGYLLVVSIFLHWTISATAAFIAVAAFVAGFVTLVVKLGDQPGRGDDDDGAVV